MTNINKNPSGQKNQMHQTKLLSPAAHAQSKQEVLRTEEAAKKWISTGIVLAAVLILAGWMISKNNTPSSVIGGVDTNEETSEETAVVVAGDRSVTVTDQAAGSNVSIAKMHLAEVTWVAIRDPKAMRVLGARRFEANQTTGEVILLRNTTAGTAYEAVLYKDDGDRKFDLHKDTLVEGVSSSFKAE